MRPVDAKLIQKRHRVIGHDSHGQRRCGVCRAAATASVHHNHLVILSQQLGQFGGILGRAHIARHEEQRLPCAMDLVVQGDVVDFGNGAVFRQVLCRGGRLGAP